MSIPLAFLVSIATLVAILARLGRDLWANDDMNAATQREQLEFTMLLFTFAPFWLRCGCRFLSLCLSPA